MSAQQGPKQRNEDSPVDPPPVQVSGWSETAPKAKWKAFPGPRTTGEALRVSISRRAYADLIGNTKESLDLEVCGALIGEYCEDEAGPFVSVEAVIPGTSARHGSSHVTFTQETWNHIHEVKESRYARMQIVGWYHSHPGFGVEFSEMDLFVHRNFFPGPAQIAYVIDPLGGMEAICVNLPQGIQSLSRFWVDGRERTCRAAISSPPQTGPGGPSLPDRAALETLEVRLGQLVQAVDEQHQALNRFLLGMTMLLALAIVGGTGYSIYRAYTHDLTPPQLNSYVRVPVKLGDRTVLIGLQVADWELPPELNAALQEELKLRLEAEEKAKQEAAEKAKQAGTPPAEPAGGKK